MKRFLITNASGMKFQVERDELGEMQTEWGESPEIVETDITDELERERINAEAYAYLSSSDWYVTRFAETGVVVPDEVSEKRQAARNGIVR